jgi:hypothetical protein
VDLRHVWQVRTKCGALVLVDDAMAATSIRMPPIAAPMCHCVDRKHVDGQGCWNGIITGSRDLMMNLLKPT